MSIYEHFTEKELDILRGRADRIARPIIDTQTHDAISALTIFVRQESYAIPTNTVSAVYKDVPIVPVPCVPEFVAGIANIRGHILPVLDLGILLKVPGESGDSASLVVINHDELSVAFLINEAGATQEIASQMVSPLPESASLSQSTYLKGLLPGEIVLLNIENLLISAMNTLAQYTA